MSTLFRNVFLGLILTVGSMYVPTGFAEDVLNASPVVQVMTYAKVQDKYLQPLGWGSASVLNTNGYLLTNNHVVMDGQGHVASEFSVCMTEVVNKTPKCDYTATLIGRDETMDLALLKLDSQTVMGTQVAFQKLKTIEVDFDYVPKTQDTVTLVGYPWIGSDTITETKGIVSGVVSYNEYQYIKTDATIAGGNSGGAMINEKGKLIGVPTYAVGGFFDSSLGYALHIAQAKTAITKWQSEPVPQINYAERLLPKEKKILADVEKSGKVEDQLLALEFGTPYEVQNYIPDTVLVIGSSDQIDNVEQVRINREETPELTNEKDFLNYLQWKGEYSEEYYKINKETLGGVPCFVPTYKEGQNLLWQNKNYYCQLGNRVLAMVNFSIMTASYDEKIIKAAQDRVIKAMEKLVLKPTYSEVIAKRQEVVQNDPYLKFKNGEHITIFGDRQTSLYIIEPYKEYILAQLNQSYVHMTSEDESKRFEEDTDGISAKHKKELMFQGKKGYVVCKEPYFSGANNYMFSGTVEGIPVEEMENCHIMVYGGMKDKNEQSYTLGIEVKGKKEHMKDLLARAYAFMQSSIEVTPGGQGETVLPNILEYVEVPFSFKDVGTQKEPYINIIKTMVSLGVFKNGEYFNPEYPMKWKDGILLYINIVFKKNLAEEAPHCKSDDKVCILLNAESTFGERKVRWKSIIIDRLGIDLNEYMESSSFQEYMQVLFYMASGVEMGKFSEEDINNFHNGVGNKKEIAEKHKQLEAFMTELYGEKMDRNPFFDGYYSTNHAEYSSEQLWYYHPMFGLLSTKAPEYTSKLPNMGHLKSRTGKTAEQDTNAKKEVEGKKLKDQTRACLKGSKDATSCLKTYVLFLLSEEDDLKTQWFPTAYEVVTKGKMVEALTRLFEQNVFEEELQQFE